ncbi:unnamed protein product [Acanthoscelides obtectus]|uniref:Uncharacterized protein n=1 Tax=Acanthoscelides obtectus TaxID=200917 RepID=A0A9P0LL93_ACAOB|nr:unnamed protein product [Acanthoscelides obtectus]CAK1670863.1 hypothetical protein AOBTE_LOCUS27882 [Acanthoscelides obtectus]
MSFTENKSQKSKPLDANQSRSIDGTVPLLLTVGIDNGDLRDWIRRARSDNSGMKRMWIAGVDCDVAALNVRKVAELIE